MVACDDLPPGVLLDIITVACDLRMNSLCTHMTERSADYASHVEEMYRDFNSPSSHRHAFMQSSSKQARRRSRRQQRMHLNQLTNSFNEDVM